MNHPLRSISFITFFFIDLLFFIHLPVSYTQDAASFARCFDPFPCGNIPNLVFPFWKEDSPEFCRNEGFGLTECEHDPPVINIGDMEFRLIFVNQTVSRMTIARDDLWERICPPPPISNITLGSPFLQFSPTNRNLTFFFGCSSSVAPPRRGATTECTSGSGINSFYADDIVDGGSYARFRQFCGDGAIQVPINQSHFEQLPREGPASFASGEWRVGFDVEYNYGEIFCGKCNGNRRLCDGLRSSEYPICEMHGGGSSMGRKLIIGLCATAGVILISCISFLCFRRILHSRAATFLRKFRNKDQDIEAFLRNNGTLAPKRYTYSEVKRMTDSFKEKLGKGGFGCVYKGKLPDNHLVAVKLLNTAKGNGQEFINEVASISRTSHVNIVTLLGFCLEGGKRALIYEFMSNGSLEKFIYKQHSPENGRRLLTVEELYRIAIGIARGLEYLHLGCNTRILHFDIKPHNILVDIEFCPKISDFGLAKLCCQDNSIISMMEARGTIGYIAPEVFCRNIGSVSHKSDVYSYGMMILEMAGGRKNLDVGVHQTSEIYFPHWIHQKLEQDNIDLALLGVLSKEEAEIARKMIIVGLWCIQTNPKDRPSISKVKEMLESKEALQIPPKP